METTAIEILKRPDQIQRRIEQLQNQQMSAFDRATSMTASYGPRVNTGGYDRHDNGLVAIASISNEIAQLIYELADAKRDVENLLSQMNQMPGFKAMRSALLLRLRYQQNLSWEGVSTELDAAGFRVPASMVTRRKWMDEALQIADTALLLKEE